MTLAGETRDALAEELYEAHETATAVDPPSDRHDLTVEDAYRIQEGVIDRRLADGADVVGHKIGLTSEGIQRQLGVDEPDFGVLLDEMFVADGVVETVDRIAPRVEGEIGFLLGESLEPPVTYVDVLRATDGVVPVAEIVDSRVRDWEIGLVDTIADNASSAGYAVGDEIHDVSGRDLSMEGVKLYRNGELAETGLGADVLGHPARAVAWLANTLDEMGDSIDAGEIVLSGSATPAVDLAEGDSVTLEFGTVGSLTLSVE